jgi:hypothetical protein
MAGMDSSTRRIKAKDWRVKGKRKARINKTWKIKALGNKNELLEKIVIIKRWKTHRIYL